MTALEYVGIAGDWHNNSRHANLAVEKFDFLDIKHIFQLGDFGLFGSLLKDSGDKFRHRLNRTLLRNDQWLYVTLGNHEDYDLLEKIPFVKAGPHEGFRCEPEAPRILYFERGQSLQLGGRNFLSIGGAASIDYQWRFIHNAMHEEKVWWPQERISVEDVNKTIAEAERLGTVDVVLAHDVFASAEIHGSHRQAPSWSAQELAFAQTSRDALEKVVAGVMPKLWLHGHYHLPITTETLVKSSKIRKTARGKIVRKEAIVKTYCFGKDETKNSEGVLTLSDLTMDYI